MRRARTSPWAPALAGLIAVAGATACESEPEDDTGLTIELYSAEGRADVLGDGVADLLELVSIQVVDPARTQARKEFDLTTREGKLAGLPIGEGYRMFVRGFLRDDADNVPRFFGATAQFAVESGKQTRISIQVGESDCVSLNRGSRLLTTLDGAEDMLTRRTGFTTTLLDDGRVLIMGGAAVNERGEPSQIYDTMEVYDPTRAQFLPLGSRVMLDRPRAWHTATPIGGGNVLVFGGLTVEDGRAVPAREVVIVNLDDRERPVRVLERVLDDGMQRAHHQATALPGGSVLITGGVGGDGAPLASTLRYFPSETGDPAQGTLLAQGDLCVARAYHSQTRLNRQNELAVVAGGLARDDAGADRVLAHMELFTVNPRQTGCCGGGTPSAARGCFVPPSGTVLAEPRFGHEAVAVDDGASILFVGGYSTPDRASGVKLLELMSSRNLQMRGRNAETGEPLVGELAMERGDLTATALMDQSVLVAGGRRGPVPVAATSRLEPVYAGAGTERALQRFRERPMSEGCGLSEPKYGHRAIAMATHSVLVVGGISGAAGALTAVGRAELYFPKVQNLCDLYPADRLPPDCQE